MKVLEYVLLLFLLIGSSSGYKILAILSNPGKSHFAVYEPLVKALAKRGHDITVLSYYPQKEHIERYTDVSLATPEKLRINVFDLANYRGYRYEKYRTIMALARMGYETCEDVLSMQSVQDLIKGNHTFDLLMAEYFDTDCFLGFAHRFKIPVVGVSSCTILHTLNERLGNPSNPAYIPNNLLVFSDKMSFFERVENTVFGLYQSFLWQILVESTTNPLVKNYFGTNTPPLSEIAYKTSLVLVNSHFSLTNPRPQVPGFVEVGGIHIGKPKALHNVRNYFLLNIK